MSSPSRDHLSYSPSLPLILSYLHYRDLPKCHLANRRIHYVINWNRTLMPKPRVRLQLNAYQLQDDYSICVAIYDVDSHAGTENYVFPTTYKIGCRDKLVRGSIEAGSHRRLATHIPVGQKALTMFLCAIYDVYSVTLIDFQARIHVEAISQAFLAVRSRATALQVWKTSPHLNQLAKHLGVGKLVVDDDYLSFEGLLEFVPWSSMVFIMNLSRPVRALSPILDIVQKWKSASCRLYYVGLNAQDTYDDNLVPRKAVPLRHFSFEDVEREFAAADQSVQIDREDREMQLTFKGETDDLALRLVYYYDSQMMYLTDIAGQDRIYSLIGCH